MGFIGKVISGVLSLLLVVGVLGAYLYFTDYGVQAVITDKGSDSGGSYVVVTPKLYPTDYKRYIDGQAADFICKGYAVTFHVRSQAYQVFDRSNALVYDSVDGVQNPAELTRCAVLG